MLNGEELVIGPGGQLPPLLPRRQSTNRDTRFQLAPYSVAFFTMSVSDNPPVSKIPFTDKTRAINPPSSIVPLTILHNATREGAVCLDGSPPGIYYRPSSNAAASKSWIIFLKGGAWCTSAADCAGRSRSPLGSSTKAPGSFGMQGPLDADPTKNPDFAAFNAVIVWYCDGASFAGDGTEPLQWSEPKNPANNATLYFRGRRVLNFVLKHLVENHGLGEANSVLFGGGSAGGLATYLGADAVHTWLLGHRSASANMDLKFRAMPVSGFFLDHADETGEYGFSDSMRDMYSLHNCSGGVPVSCLSSLPPASQWKCVFANYSYAYSETPMFLLQSSHDLWQLFGIARMGPGWDQGCLNRGIQFKNCTESQIRELNSFATALLGDVERTRKFRQPKEGGFVESCLEHQAAISSASFNNYTIAGVSMREALGRWWNAEGNASAFGGGFKDKGKMWHLPCTLHTAEPHQCNPSCMP